MRTNETDSSHIGTSNPYQTPGIERLHHTSIYQWPLPASKSLSFTIDIDHNQLLKCVADNNRLVTMHFLSTLISSVLFLVTLLAWLTVLDTSFFLLLVCALSFLWMCYSARRCSCTWHARRFGKQFYWMWGPVHIQIDGDGILWTSDQVVLGLHWDSFHQLTWCTNTIWFATNHPFALEIPIHRDWVNESIWGDLRHIAESHKGFYDKEDFWRLVRQSPVSFKEAAAPDIQAVPNGAIPFRGQGLGGRYGCETTASLMKGGDQWTFLAFILLTFGLHSPLGKEWDQSFGIAKNGFHMYLYFAMIFFSSSLSALLRWFPAGVGFYQWSQTLISSQSGFVASDIVLVASPACCLTAKVGRRISVRQEKECIVLELHRKFGQSLVIPRDQFTPLDAF